MKQNKKKKAAQKDENITPMVIVRCPECRATQWVGLYQILDFEVIPCLVCDAEMQQDG